MGAFDDYTAARRRDRAAQPQRTVGQNIQDAGLGAADMLTFGWGDELAGLVNEDWKYGWRDASRQAEISNPLFYYGGMAAGGLLPGAGLLSVAGKAARLAPGVGAAGRMLASPGLGMGGRVAAGSITGGIGGAAAGAGFANEGDRAMGGATGAAFGAGLGALSVPFMAGVGAVGRKALTPFRRDPVIDGAIPTGGGMAGVMPAEGALDDFIRTMTRGPRKTADDMQAYVSEGLADPGRGRTLMDAMGRAGTKKMRSEYGKPGEAADLAEAQFLERARGSRDRLERGVSGVTSGDPLMALNSQVDDIAKKELGPWLGRATRNVAQNQTVLTNLSRRPSVAGALKTADEQIDEHIAAGMLPASAKGDPATRLHYARMVLQDGARDPTRLASSMRTMTNANLVSASNAISKALDDVTPGYRAALDALRARMQPRSMVKAARVAQRTDRSNVAGNMLGQPNVRRAIETDLPEFGKALRAEDELFRNSQRVLSGSDTASNVGELLSQATAASQRAPSIAGAAQDAWQATFGQLGRELFGEMSEKRSNELVRLMLQKVDDPNPAVRAQVEGFLTQLRSRLQQLEARSAMSARNAAEWGGGVAGNRVEEF
jgi:hypothetical protein